VRCRDATASSLSQNFGAKTLHILSSRRKKVTAACGIDCFACQDEFFAVNPFDAKGNDEQPHDFALRLYHLYLSR
jgi:hypothetical protein